jgi:hypothetical protein
LGIDVFASGTLSRVVETPWNKEVGMRGRQKSQHPLFACVRLEEMIPEDHILRRIRQGIDFSFIDGLTAPLYSHTGRPSVDPQVLCA